jgi:hypothetical protein
VPDGPNARVEVGAIFKRDEANRQHNLPVGSPSQSSRSNSSNK